jgi:hypothetical protein
MASTAERLREPDLLRSYLRNLSRQGGTPDLRLDDGRQVRTCPNCGARSVFRPEDTWYRCTACGQYA